MGVVVVDPIKLVLGSGENVSGELGELKQEVSVPLSTIIADEFAISPRLGILAWAI